MSEANAQDDDSNSRRDFLGKITGGLTLIGLGATAWPFIHSMNPSQDVRAKGTAEVDLSAIPEGKVQTVSWRGQPVFVYHRPAQVIEAMRESQGSQLDPMADAERAQEPEWLVIVGICTHLGCVPQRVDHGWLCPCHGSRFDNSGRVTKGPAPRNLEVPPYQLTNGTIQIG